MDEELIDDDFDVEEESDDADRICCPYCKSADLDCKHFLGSKDRTFTEGLSVDDQGSLSNLSGDLTKLDLK